MMIQTKTMIYELYKGNTKIENHKWYTMQLGAWWKGLGYDENHKWYTSHLSLSALSLSLPKSFNLHSNPMKINMQACFWNLHDELSL